uniref:Uncharacterized protein LOC114346491 n=1 Tax=Diabrotica virgifera virgifera TaxID=50390 RepID=A0A6P7H5N0_DIAVI
MSAVYNAVKNELNFQGKLSSFRKVVKKLGFKWQKTNDNRKILMEKSHIRAKRTEYLKKIKKYRAECYDVIYTDETYLHSSHTTSKSWDDGTSKCLKSPVAKGQWLIIVHAGGEKGFVPNGLLIFKSGQRTGDYHNDMNHENFIRWLQEKLIPNLQHKTALVLDNASYHNVACEAAPTSSWKKMDIQRWLTERCIYFAVTDTKPELYEKIKLNKPAHKQYVVDTIMAKQDTLYYVFLHTTLN